MCYRASVTHRQIFAEFFMAVLVPVRGNDLKTGDVFSFVTQNRGA
ncbi:hypothetical protein FDUTEX481_04832 [Tolypothrix sp. PCC 7601]|nr:hypothetical protein FDUTEX481_04832 [Tolypothrix sp. PCC 7601]